MRKIFKIHQFHPGSAYGDGVTNGLFFTQKILHYLGFESEIYCIHIDPQLQNQIRDFRTYCPSSDQILMIHHSMGTDEEQWIENIEDQKIMVYHNITPEFFFPEGSHLYHYAKLGRVQLNRWAKKFVAAIGDSNLNSQELIDNGYQSVSTIPLLVDVKKIISHPWDKQIQAQYKDTLNLIFVGRIAENKAQLDLIEILYELNQIFYKPFHLILIGGTTSPAYLNQLEERIGYYNLQYKVHFTGKVSDDDLYAYYRIADAFICMSEHEGFGIPLIEAMLFDIPVIAFNSSNVSSTLKDAGILFNKKSHIHMAACLKLVVENPLLRRKIIISQRRRIEDFGFNKLASQLADFLKNIGIAVEKNEGTFLNKNKPVWRIEGPFDSSYSLAILNRNLAKELYNIGLDVVLHSTEGYGDFDPNQDFLISNPDILKLWLNNQKIEKKPEVVLRNLYPPRTTEMQGITNCFSNYGWEESVFPSEWISAFNKDLHLLTTMSDYVSQTMINNGLSIPVVEVGVGADHILNLEPKPLNHYLGHGFRFLHISSCFPRKGVDALLLAYAKAFNNQDNVTLIIKTFPNPHNTIEAQISEVKKSYHNIGQIILINEDLPEEAVVSLYKEAHAFVAPSRGEGFGLPLAEAMLFDLPVITTNYSGQTDFCNSGTAWLCDYSFVRAQTHFNLYHSYWAEPDVNHLAMLMREVYEASPEVIRNRTDAAKKRILEQFAWKKVAERTNKAIQAINHLQPFRLNRPRVGWVSTWNTRCGIAAYSAFLLKSWDVEDYFIFANYHDTDKLESQDSDNVLRCWQAGWDDSLDHLFFKLIELNVDFLIIQFNFGFFFLRSLGNLIQRVKKHRIKIIIFFHATSDVDKLDFKASLSEIKNDLACAERLFVHSITDINRLKGFNLINNVALFPHGISLNKSLIENNFAKNLLWKDSKIISSYGFILPYKGIQTLIKAFFELRAKHTQIRLLLINSLYPASESEKEIELCRQLIKSSIYKNDILMINDYLQDDESLILLQQSDLLVFPYQNTQESSSAAVRMGISSGRPVACTPLEIFEDVCDAVHFLPGISTKDVAKGIEKILFSEDLIVEQKKKQNDWLIAHDWEKLSDRLWNIINGLLINYHPFKG